MGSSGGKTSGTGSTSTLILVKIQHIAMRHIGTKVATTHSRRYARRKIGAKRKQINWWRIGQL